MQEKRVKYEQALQEELARQAQQAKEQKEREELEALLAAERLREEELEREEARKQEAARAAKELLQGKFAQEPTEGDMATITFRMPNGQRVTRKFLAEDRVGTLYEWVSSLEQESYGFENPGSDVQLLVPMPRKVYDQLDEVLRDTKLYPKALLTVKEL